MFPPGLQLPADKGRVVACGARDIYKLTCLRSVIASGFGEAGAFWQDKIIRDRTADNFIRLRQPARASAEFRLACATDAPRLVAGSFTMPDLIAACSGAETSSYRQSSLISSLKEIFRDEGVPHNFIWLAEVESSLNPEAESKAGAVGLFQLMPATAERFGLQLFPVDDRKTPDKSARAAACYLRQLYKEFGGWALALAAYNAGEGRVSRTMKLHNARTFHEVAPHLPSETRKYVPRVMAMMALREDQSRGMSSAAYFQP